MATRQPSEDKEFWHWETIRLNSGGVVSGAGAEEEDELELELELELTEEELASSAGKLEEEDEKTVPPPPPPPKPDGVPGDMEYFGSRLALAAMSPEEDTEKEKAPDSALEEKFSAVSFFKAKA